MQQKVRLHDMRRQSLKRYTCMHVIGKKNNLQGEYLYSYMRQNRQEMQLCIFVCMKILYLKRFAVHMVAKESSS